ncbi:hypothetical protein [Halomonas sp. CKK8]|uniref:hypothetical protein n=1 Tax=Halomonas sp. CKK8 TaxID=3036127 RepID=UPI00241512BA|nr:hypothetical protein [Halomonas sp. CKK8]WFM71905.1 hypothetical protein P8934_02625 [Halomonas sp. CKK8]
MSSEVVVMIQTLFYVLSPLVTLMAVSVAYISLVRQMRPHILVYYRPNKDLQTFIDLVVENVGGGMAKNVVFSQPLPIKCFGIGKADDDGDEVLGDGLPAIAAGQVFVFDGGQYGGLSSRVGEKLEVEVRYSYTNPFGFVRRRKELSVLSVSHLGKMPTRTSAGQAIVDALGGVNVTTLHKVDGNLASIASSLDIIAKNNVESGN